MSNDPFSVKKALIDLVDKHLGVKNPDLYEAGFLGYLIQALTLLTSDCLFNNALSYNEAFTHLLVLPTSLQNHANMLDYTLSSAEPCSGNITIFVPVPENSTYQLTLKNGTVCEGDNQYLIKNTYYINVYPNNRAKIQKKDALTGIITEIEYQNRVNEGDKLISFQADVWQININSITEKFKNVVYKEFYDVNVSGITNQFHSINVGVYVQDDNLSIPRLLKFNQVDSIYTCGASDKCYTFKYYGDGRGTIRFGNGVFGYQPKEGTTANILIYSTKGEDGVAYPGSIQLSTKLVDFYSGEQVSIYGTNFSIIDNGVNEENIEAAKSHIISNISSAKRLVTKDDYLGFEGITGVKNLELYPMLLRRDTNVNEIDLFSILYDKEGKPVPSTNVNYIINDDRTLLSKEYVYKLAIKNGNYGVELIPNTVKYINKTSFMNTTVKRLYSGLYIDSEYDNYNPNYAEHDKMIMLKYNTGEVEYVSPDEVKELVCPFNLSIEEREDNKVGVFEYIPYNINNVPQLEDQIDYIDIDMTLTSVQFDLDPLSSMTKTNVIATGIHIINNLTISDNVLGEMVRSYVRFTSEDGETVSKVYECSSKFISPETNELITDVIIPINELIEGNVKFEYIVYYSDKYYNTYSKYLTFKNPYEESIVTTYIGYPISFLYNPADESTKQPEPAIDKVYIGVTNVNINWSSGENTDGSTIDGYLVDVEINKLETVDTNKIRVSFTVGYENQTYYPIDNPAIYNNIKCVYSFRIPYNPLYIMDGATHYTVTIDYLFKDDDGTVGTQFSTFATYSGFATFRRRFSDLMWCNIEKETTGNYKIYKIPAIEKSYYEANKDYLEDNIFYQLALLDSNTVNYKMLTDRMNFKFAKTIGVTENLKFNDSVENIDDSLKYNDWVCGLPPDIKISILVSRESNRSKQDIINECKKVVLSFLTVKASFNAKIIRSELARFLHDAVSDIVSCEIIEPAKDIIYFYEEQELPKDKDTLLSYNPEFLYIDVNKIKIDIKQMPA